MTSRTIVKHSEELDRAAKWLAEELEARPETTVADLVSEAGPRFNLSPADQEALMHIARKARKRGI